MGAYFRMERITNGCSWNITSMFQVFNVRKTAMVREEMHKRPVRMTLGVITLF